jgi:hypothetical protein
MVIAGVHDVGHAQLFEITQAHALLRAPFGAGQRGQQQGRQNGDDGDNHQQFYQRKPRASVGILIFSGENDKANLNYLPAQKQRQFAYKNRQKRFPFSRFKLGILQPVLNEE